MRLYYQATGDCHPAVVAPYRNALSRAHGVFPLSRAAQPGKPCRGAYLVTTVETGVCIIAMTNNHKPAIVRTQRRDRRKRNGSRAYMSLRLDSGL